METHQSPEMIPDVDEVQPSGFFERKRKSIQDQDFIEVLRRIFMNPKIELILIALWAVWVGRNLLDFNPYTWPIGREFGYQIEGHHFWTQLKSCGLCALWNGSINGGGPAFADLFSSKLHPFVAIPALLWGVIPGVKVTIVIALWMAGAAQWWLARSLKLGRTARIWSAFLVVVGGHLLGRLELGSPGLVLSTAASSLALAAAVELGVTGQRKSTLRLAVTGALAIVSGVGYLQLGLVFWAPAFLFLLLNKEFTLRPIWREYLLAVLLCLMLIGLVLVPAMHFLPNLVKFTDPTFNAAQPLEYIPLNLVIRDQEFMKTEILGKFAFEYLYHLYIGWVPILLAALWLRSAPRSDYPILLCLSSGAFLMFFFASAIPLRWLVKWMPGLAGFRHAPLIAGMAVPAILGLASYGLEHLLALDWPKLILRPSSNTTRTIPLLNLAWVLVIPLAWSLKSAYDLEKNFLDTVDATNLYETIDALNTPDLQWVSPPFGEHHWVEPAVAEGLKLTSVVSVSHWEDREEPKPKLVAMREAAPENTELVGNLDGTPIYQFNDLNYAYVVTEDRTIPCTASGKGGDLVIQCSNSIDGKLIIEENSWSGWKAKRDNESISLFAGQWLSVEAPAGQHEYQFRYRPWDVAIGFLLSLTGVVLIIVLWIRSYTPRSKIQT